MPNNCFAVCQGARNRQNRQLINKLWYLLALDDGSLERGASDLYNAARFNLIDILNRLAHLRTHAKHNGKQCSSCVIQTNVANEQMASALRCSRNQPKRRRGDVAGNSKVA